MTIKRNVLMITAAAFISTGAAFAETATTTTVEEPDLTFLLQLLSGDDAPTRWEVRQALLDEGFLRPRVRLDDDGEVRVRFVDADGQQWRVRIEDGKIVRLVANDDGADDTSDANGDDTSDTSDSNGGSSDNTSDGNGGSSSNSGSGGSSDN